MQETDTLLWIYLLLEAYVQIVGCFHLIELNVFTSTSLDGVGYARSLLVGTAVLLSSEEEIMF